MKIQGSYLSACYGKAKFRERASAYTLTAKKNRKNKKAGDPKGAMQVYKCGYCGHYHMGHRPWVTRVTRTDKELA